MEFQNQEEADSRTETELLPLKIPKGVWRWSEPTHHFIDEDMWTRQVHWCTEAGLKSWFCSQILTCERQCVNQSALNDAVLSIRIQLTPSYNHKNHSNPQLEFCIRNFSKSFYSSFQSTCNSLICLFIYTAGRDFPKETWGDYERKFLERRTSVKEKEEEEGRKQWK